jgi:hypothetical protein
MADEQRTPLAAPVEPPAEDEGGQLPARRSADAMRDLLPAIEPERRLND